MLDHPRCRIVWRPCSPCLALRSFGLAAALACAALQAHSAPLTLDDALRLAEQRSRLLPAQDAAALSARERAVAAGRRPDPVLKAGIVNLPADGADRFSLTRDFMTMRSLGVMQEFTRNDKLRARSARAEREAQLALAGRELARADLQRDTALAWLDRHFQERMRELLRAQRDEARLQVEAADAVYRGGRGSQADLFAARQGVAQIEDRIAEAERQVATATTQLARWVGAAEASEALGAPPPLDTVGLGADALAERLAHHPQIEILTRQEAVADAEADLARSERQADVSVEVMYSQRGPAYSNMVSLNLAIPLQWDRKNRQDRELAARLAGAEQIRHQREEAIRTHLAEATAMLQTWRSQRERLQRYDASLLPLARERTQAALAAYRGGTGPLAAVLDARRSEIDTRIDRLRIEMDAASLWARLEYLVPGGQAAAAMPRR
jgi:outer membrane protein TolC